MLRKPGRRHRDLAQGRAAGHVAHRAPRELRRSAAASVASAGPASWPGWSRGRRGRDWSGRSISMPGAIAGSTVRQRARLGGLRPGLVDEVADARADRAQRPAGSAHGCDPDGHDHLGLGQIDRSGEDSPAAAAQRRLWVVGLEDVGQDQVGGSSSSGDIGRLRRHSRWLALGMGSRVDQKASQSTVSPLWIRGSRSSARPQSPL